MHKQFFNHILLGIDDSAASSRARDFAASLALNQGACVTVVYSNTTANGMPTAGFTTQSNATTINAVQAFGIDAVERLRDAGISQVNMEVVEELAAGIMTNKAQQYKADLIILGMRSAGEWGYTDNAYSSAPAVMQQAPCPVLIVQ
jgi:nucleotide-binding universal stress UspA family protein